MKTMAILYPIRCNKCGSHSTTFVVDHMRNPISGGHVWSQKTKETILNAIKKLDYDLDPICRYEQAQYNQKYYRAVCPECDGEYSGYYQDRETEVFFAYLSGNIEGFEIIEYNLGRGWE